MITNKHFSKKSLNKKRTKKINKKYVGGATPTPTPSPHYRRSTARSRRTDERAKRSIKSTQSPPPNYNEIGHIPPFLQLPKVSVFKYAENQTPFSMSRRGVRRSQKENKLVKNTPAPTVFSEITLPIHTPTTPSARASQYFRNNPPGILPRTRPINIEPPPYIRSKSYT